MSFEFLYKKSILVTGGTGSFGQKFVRTLLEHSRASRIIIFSRDEMKQSQMEATIPDPDKRLRFFIGDIRDLERLQRAFHGVDFVVHAAALKQVPVLEYNPFEAVKTNILGTQNVINAAIDQGVERVLLVSTDKAANPANLYGATKLCAERLMISYGARKTIFGVVRYGNVLGSRGSILHVLREQAKTGEVMLTHEDMTRFWITLERGIDLVLHGLEQMQGGEIYVPKIPSMRIRDFISTIAPDCRVKIIGIRPGEKLHEMLVTPEEARHAKEYGDHYVIFPETPWAGGDYRTAGGADMPPGASFASNTNTEWLDAEGLRRLVVSL